MRVEGTEDTRASVRASSLSCPPQTALVLLCVHAPCRTAHSQHTLNKIPKHSLRTIYTLATHTQHTHNTLSTHSQHTSNTLSSHSQHSPNTNSTHSQHTLARHADHARQRDLPSFRRCKTGATPVRKGGVDLEERHQILGWVLRRTLHACWSRLWNGRISSSCPAAALLPASVAALAT